jgi:amidase
VRDSALFLSLTEVDNAALGPRVGYIQEPLARPLRIAFYRQTLMGQEPSAEVMQALMHTVQLCEALGHELHEVAAPSVSGQAVSDGFFTIAGFGMTQLVAMMSPLLGRAPGPSELEPFTLELIDWFSSLPEGAVARAISALDVAGMQLRTFVSGYDAVLCPTMPTVPPALGSLAPTLDRTLLLSRTEQLAGYTPIHNIAGLPAMSVPLYWTEQGIPIGSHFAAQLGDEALLLGLAYQLERAASWSQRIPALASSIHRPSDQ